MGQTPSVSIFGSVPEYKKAICSKMGKTHLFKISETKNLSVQIFEFEKVICSKFFDWLLASDFQKSFCFVALQFFDFIHGLAIPRIFDDLRSFVLFTEAFTNAGHMRPRRVRQPARHFRDLIDGNAVGTIECRHDIQRLGDVFRILLV